MSELRQLLPGQLGTLVNVRGTERLLNLSGLSGQRVGTRSDAARRQIGNIKVAEVTVDESHDDTMTITEHPVDHGAAIADHAFVRPAEVRIRIGYSAAYVQGPVRDIYSQILALQASRQPFDVWTGKREYHNMLIESIRTQSNSGLEYTFLADIALRQIILVQTSTIPVSSVPSNLLMSDKNMPTVNTGQVNVQAANVTYNQALVSGLSPPKAEMAGLIPPRPPIELPFGQPWTPQLPQLPDTSL
jgi:hypothetical protein